MLVTWKSQHFNPDKISTTTIGQIAKTFCINVNGLERMIIWTSMIPSPINLKVLLNKVSLGRMDVYVKYA